MTALVKSMRQVGLLVSNRPLESQTQGTNLFTSAINDTINRLIVSRDVVSL